MMFSNFTKAEVKQIQNINGTRATHRALRCAPWSSQQRILVRFPGFWQSVGSHECATTPTKLKHLICTQLNLQVKLEQLNLSKTYMST
jgi:hypothetical protein